MFQSHSDLVHLDIDGDVFVKVTIFLERGFDKFTKICKNAPTLSFSPLGILIPRKIEIMGKDIQSSII